MPSHDGSLKPLQITQMATLRAAGETIAGIAAIQGINKATVSKRLSKPEIKAWIEQQAEQLALECTHDIIENHKATIRLGRQIIQRVSNQTKIKFHNKDTIDKLTGEAVKTTCQVEELEALSESDKAILALADKKEHRIGQSIGIFPSQSPSIVVQNIFAVQNLTVLAPAVAQLLGGQLNIKRPEGSEGEIIDVMSREIEGWEGEED